MYVTEIGEFGKDGDGQVSVIVDGKAKPFATGLDDPKGIVAFQNAFYVTDKTRVVKVDAKAKPRPSRRPTSFRRRRCSSMTLPSSRNAARCS